jgi:hypothetical protein
MAKKAQEIPHKRTTPTRKNRVSFMLNDDEFRALNRYVEKYKIANQSRFIRETLITSILKRLEEDHPTLF